MKNDKKGGGSYWRRICKTRLRLRSSQKKLKITIFLLFFASAYFTVGIGYLFKPSLYAQADQINSRRIGTAGQYVDLKGVDYQVEIWATTNRRNGDTDYFLLSFPKVGSAPYPLIVFINPYSIFPAPPSSNPEDNLWTDLIKNPGPYYDVSLLPQNKFVNCSTPTGDCVVTTTGLASLSDLASLGDVSMEGRTLSNVDWALTNGYAVAVAFTRHYAARDIFSAVYSIQDPIEALKAMSSIDGNKVGVMGRSQGGHLSIHPLANPDFPLSIAAAVAEAGWVDARAVHNYYLDELSRIQPPSLYARSYDFVAQFLNRLYPALGTDLTGPWWRIVTTDSVASRFNTPLLLLHSSDDTMIPVSESNNFYTALKNRNKPVSKWIFDNGAPPLTNKSADEGAHGLMDANSSVKRRILARNFFLDRMPPNILEVTVRVPQEADPFSMLSEFRNSADSSPEGEAGISDLIVQAANPQIRYISSDPNIPSGNGPEVIAAVVNAVWADEGLNWDGTNVIQNLQNGLLPSSAGGRGAIRTESSFPLLQQDPQAQSSQPSQRFSISIPGLPIVQCGTSTTPDCTRCDLFKLLKNLIDFTVGVLMPAVAILLFVWAGFLILMGGASPNLVAQGRGIFSTTFFGILIMLSAWMITNTLIKSIGSNYDNADTWWQFTCVETAPAVPPVVQPPSGQPPSTACNQNFGLTPSSGCSGTACVDVSNITPTHGCESHDGVCLTSAQAAQRARNFISAFNDLSGGQCSLRLSSTIQGGGGPSISQCHKPGTSKSGTCADFNLLPNYDSCRQYFYQAARDSDAVVSFLDEYAQSCRPAQATGGNIHVNF